MIKDGGAEFGRAVIVVEVISPKIKTSERCMASRPDCQIVFLIEEIDVRLGQGRRVRCGFSSTTRSLFASQSSGKKGVDCGRELTKGRTLSNRYA